MTRERSELLRLLHRYPDGVTLVDLMTRTGWTHHVCTIELRAMEAGGLAARMQSQGKDLWTTADNLTALRAKRQKEAADKSRAVLARLRAAKMTPEEREAEEAACEAFARRPRHAIVAQQCWAGTIAVPGPASVFDLARSAA